MRLQNVSRVPAPPTRLHRCGKRVGGPQALGCFLDQVPNWGSFQRLHTLEIIGATLRDSALKDAVHACPNLTHLALLGCDGIGSVSIELERLEKCRLDFLGPGNCSLLLSSPSLQVLEIQGFSWVRVSQNHRLRTLCIAKNTGDWCRIFNKMQWKPCFLWSLN